METTHRVRVGDSADMAGIPDGTVDLVVTSPPYPMIEMWDGLFRSREEAIGRALDAGRGEEAFGRMHALLDPTWKEVARVLRPGGIACVNVGDAARKIGTEFEVYPNHVLVSQALRRHGLRSLPPVLWRKSTNKPNKFLGSGMYPAGAYVTLEHEHVLLARKGGVRAFSPSDRSRRRESAYFWEERNAWFSDVWSDVRGARQGLAGGAGRSRSAAFPLEFAVRLVLMHSLLEDTVLDPFLGTGTTTLAAVAAGRHSLGYEIDPSLERGFRDRLSREFADLADLPRRRLLGHLEFVRGEQARGRVFAHRSEPYGCPVVTAQERDLRLYAPTEWKETGPGEFEVRYAATKLPA